GQPIGEPLTGHTGRVSSVATTVLDDRPVAVTGSVDETVRVWDLTTGQQITPLLFFPEPVLAVAVAPGRELLVGFGWELACMSPR
ncbi:hypothetical protein ACFC1P_29865, partial [Streptomyces sp. NPDC056154]